jgi:hypothetical protein
MEGPIMERTDWLLMAVAAGGAKGLSPVQLQKSLFLLGRAYGAVLDVQFYEFIPYDYGPFCIDIYRDAEKLQQMGYVEIRRQGSQWPEHFATASGSEYARELKEIAPRHAYDYLVEVVQWAQSLSFPALVRAIYDAFPEFKQNSVFQDSNASSIP